MLQANQRVGEYVLDERISQSALDEVGAPIITCGPTSRPA